MKQFVGIGCEITDEESIFLSHITDLVRKCEKEYSPVYTRFLDERRMMLAKTLVRNIHGSDFTTYGGFTNASRQMMCIYPEYCCPENEDFPLKAICFSYRKQDEPTHSQFLGTIMSLMIERELVGDIDVGNGKTIVVVSDTIASQVMFLEKIGRTGVSTSYAEKDDLIRTDSFDEINISVSSMRLDCIASGVIRLSRDKTSSLIRSEGADVNFCRCSEPSKLLSEGDVFSIRGKGKFRIGSEGGTTRSGRQYITVYKYK